MYSLYNMNGEAQIAMFSYLSPNFWLASIMSTMHPYYQSLPVRFPKKDPSVDIQTAPEKVVGPPKKHT